MDAEDQEKIFTEIYAECDNNNVNNVQVSVLLSYIGPYIDSSSHHFEELKNALDPDNANPFIDKTTFLNAMMCWSQKFKNEVDFNFNNDEISRQSTPTKNLRVDYDVMNLSSISAYSLTGSVLSTTVDANILQEQNNELQHQNKKLSECLDDVKYQLTALEEQNVFLQNDIERIHKNSQSDQKLIKSLQSKCAEYEKEREEHTKIVHENKVNHDNLVQNKRIKYELENRIKELETQNKAYIETIEKLNDISEVENEKLRKEIEERDAEIMRIQEREAEWRRKCTQNELNIQQFIAEKSDLKSHIQSLEALLQNEAQEGGQLQRSLKMENFEPDQEEDNDKDNPTAVTLDKQKSISLSPEDDLCDKLLAMQRQASPHESLHSELSNISTSGACFNTCEYKINQLEDEICTLYDELRERGEQLEIVQSAKARVEQELTSEINQLKQNMETALKEKHQLEIEKKQTNRKLNYYKMINKNFKVQLDTKSSEMRKKLKEKQTHLTNLETEVQDKLNKLKMELSCRENENKKKSEEMLEMQGSLKMFEEQVKELKQINCKLMNEISSLERAAKLERKRNTRIDLNSKINDLEEQLEGVKSKNQQLVATISGITSEKQQLISKLEVLENNDYGKRKVESLEAKLHKYRKKLTDLENQLVCKSKEAQECEHLNVEFKKLHEDHATLIAYVKSVKTTINTNKDLLKTTTYYTSDVWNSILRKFFPDLNISNLLNITKSNEHGPLEDEINLLNNQIHVTTLLLKAFAKIKNEMMIIDEENNKWTLSSSITTTTTKTTTTSINNNSNSNKIDIRKLYNPHESEEINNESFLSKLTPKRFLLKPPTLVLKSKSKIHFQFPPMSPECSNQQQQQLNTDTELNNNVRVMENQVNKEDAVDAAQTSSINSTFTLKSSINDSFIERILTEEKMNVEPLTKMDQTEILENSDSASTSSLSNDEQNDEDENEENKDNKKKLKKELKLKEEEEMIKERLTRQVRSMSEGAAVVHQLSKDGDVMVFPNLQDTSLNALGLSSSESSSEINDQSKERLTEEEVELKFQTLALAFSIDAVTIKDRLERQQRQRDQAEDNLSAEVARFMSAVHKLHPLCVDAETTELVTSLLDRLQLIVQASHRISTSAEIFGSVQQEWRIAQSVTLMLSHLRNLIKQRDAARRQLQITKRMLQETTSASVLKKPGVATTRRLTINTLPASAASTTMKGMGPPRRASIAVISRPLDSPSVAVAPVRRVPVRRTSEAVSVERQEPLSMHWDYKRVPEWTQMTTRPPLLSRPSRLDINPELTKIQEGSTESFTSNLDDVEAIESISNSDDDIDFQTPTADHLFTLTNNDNDNDNSKMKKMLRYYGECAIRVFEEWAANGTLHEICFIGTIICFAMATILLCNTIMEIELARDGVRQVPWKWVTWKEFCALFYTKS